MQKIFATFLLISMFSFGLPTFAIDKTKVEPPKWEDYVPEKYQNPREDFTRGGAIAEMAVGIELTALIITSPIGIPMICHGSTKFKHVSYRGRKAKFETGLIEAEKIQDPVEKQEFYKQLLKKCKLRESQKAKLAKKRAKKAEKEAKKLEKIKREIESTKV